MSLKIYNTLTRQKEIFIPLDEKNVRVYSCGPTVYDEPTVGNRRSYIFADLLGATIKYIGGYPLTHVVNITDVGHLISDGDYGEDKLEKGAKREGKSAWNIAKQYEKGFKKGMKELNIRSFDVMPRATDHIDEQIDLVKILEDKGYTYAIPDDGIYMDTSKIEDYGKLIGPNYKKHIEGLKSGARVEDTGKKNITDFALWKFSKIGEQRDMERESPRGKGFPGRHAECSAMSSKYLGKQFDIHTGGIDHIPIHHTDEIAQTECAFGVNPWVKYWMHNAFLTIDGGKMGKSLGNAYTLADVIEKGFSALDLRYFYFMAQYRKQQDFTRNNIESAHNARINLQKKIHTFFDLDDTIKQNLNNIFDRKILFAELITPEAKGYLENLVKALSDDLNMPEFLASFNAGFSTPSEELIMIMYWFEFHIMKVGLFEKKSDEVLDIPKEIYDFADQRVQAKKDKNYTLADQLRKQIQELGFQVRDIAEGYEIEKK